MGSPTIIGKIDLSKFDKKPIKVRSVLFGFHERQEMYDYIYRLIGYNRDGSDLTIVIEASSKNEAESVIRSFYGGDYVLESK